MYLFAITFGFGVLQTMIVKGIIGMNGSKKDVKQDTFGINTDFSLIKSRGR